MSCGVFATPSVRQTRIAFSSIPYASSVANVGIRMGSILIKAASIHRTSLNKRATSSRPIEIMSSTSLVPMPRGARWRSPMSTALCLSSLGVSRPAPRVRIPYARCSQLVRPRSYALFQQAPPFWVSESIRSPRSNDQMTSLGLRSIESAVQNFGPVVTCAAFPLVMAIVSTRILPPKARAPQILKPARYALWLKCRLWSPEEVTLLPSRGQPPLHPPAPVAGSP